MSRQILIDVQFLQTDAYERGMGRYFCELFLAMLAENKIDTYHCVYTTALADTNIKQLQQSLQDRNLTQHVTFQALDLQIHDFKAANYLAAAKHNRLLVTDYAKAQLASHHATVWLVPCLMQEPTIPVFPEDPKISTAVIWYDLIPYLLYGHYFQDQQSSYAESYLSRLNMLPTVDHIFSISLASKNDLVEFLSIPEYRITNIRGSINQTLPQGKATNLPPKVKAPFFLCPASAEPSKNVRNTIKGFGLFNAVNDNKYQLVITSNYDERLAAEADTYAQNVIFTGHISPDMLGALFSNCQALLFASTHEGLGLPILEAVHFSKKVICSAIPAFQELEGRQAFYWCDPLVPQSIAEALTAAIAEGVKLSATQKASYHRIEEIFNWHSSATAILQALQILKPHKLPTKTIAIVGPHPASFSTIGKVIGEAYPYLAEVANVHYYYDSGPSDKRHGLVHFHYLAAYEHLYPIDELPSRIQDYDRLIYHMGTSDHHMKTYLLAKSFPGTLIVHDTDLAGKGLSGQMLSNGYISSTRLKLELNLESQFLKQPERFLASLVSSQSKVITHSRSAAKVVHEYFLGSKQNIVACNLPISTQELVTDTLLQSSGPIQLGMVGILAGVKGLDLIEWLFRETQSLKGCHLNVFGFGFFADKKRLAALQQTYSNLTVTFDLSDLEYKNLLSQLDVLINYRTTYNGETSRSTLEAMRSRIVPVVRNIGWYSELTKNSCFQLDDLRQLPQLISEFGHDSVQTRQRLAPMIEAGQELLRETYNFTDYVKVLTED